MYVHTHTHTYTYTYTQIPEDFPLSAREVTALEAEVRSVTTAQ